MEKSSDNSRSAATEFANQFYTNRSTSIAKLSFSKTIFENDLYKVTFKVIPNIGHTVSIIDTSTIYKIKGGKIVLPDKNRNQQQEKIINPIIKSTTDHLDHVIKTLGIKEENLIISYNGSYTSVSIKVLEYKSKHTNKLITLDQTSTISLVFDFEPQDNHLKFYPIKVPVNIINYIWIIYLTTKYFTKNI